MARLGLRLLAFLFGIAVLRAGEVRRAVPAVRIDGREYVRMADVAARLKADLRWIEAGRRAQLSFEGHRVELVAGGHFSGLLAYADGLEVFLGDPALSRGGELYVSRIDLERRLVPLMHWGWGGEVPRTPRIITIDPGHGGWDPGKENPRLHLQEKTLTLDTALRLRKLLEAGGYRVVMTRSDDRAVAAKKEEDLPLRAAAAVAAHADLFISIHFNSGSGGDTHSHGTEVYTFAPLHQSSTDSTLERKNDAWPNRDHPGVPAANALDHWNVVFAHAVHRELNASLHTEDRGEKLMHLAVLRDLDCPGILVESAFISNDAEARRAAEPAFRQQIAEALLAGIQRYARELDTLRPGPREPGSAHPAAPAAAQPLQRPTRPSRP
ncbi:MAG TPA: N-acetylmuramoyl-L-alanine amidase [Opitutaceae bacterium]|nr:N-acetylmuramoyl-L-alanine amidase [Opitutaceae bacterium]